MVAAPSIRILVAGASGAIGRPLCRLLLEEGWQVTGTTRSVQKADALRSIGVTPVVVDVYDQAALIEALLQARPTVVIHQLTDLPPGLDRTRMAQALASNARLREVGTRNLVAAAQACGAGRMIAQSIAFAYARGPLPHAESAPLNVAAADDAGGLTARGVASLEQQVLGAGFTGIVLRYGKLYGPGTGFEQASPGGPVHVDAAADAARRAVTRGAAGIYNVAEDDGTVAVAKVRVALDWRADFRLRA